MKQMNYRMKYLFLKTFLLCFPIFFFAQTKGKVIGIKDGDTIEVLLDGNTPKVLRLAEVDCPESGQAFGKNAKSFTSSLVFGKIVTFKVTSVDRWGRSVAKVYQGKKYISEELIKEGMGWHYHQYSNSKKLARLQLEAKKNKIGLWQDKNPKAPWDYRKDKRKKKR